MEQNLRRGLKAAIRSRAALVGRVATPGTRERTSGSRGRLSSSAGRTSDSIDEEAQMAVAKSLRASVQGDPVFVRRVNGWLTMFWLAMIPVAL